MTGARFPLSASQRRVWSLHARDPTGFAHTTGRCFAVSGALDPRALQAAVDALVARHEALRTSFPTDGDAGPVQSIQPARAVRIAVIDVAGDEPAVLRRARAAIELAFDLRSDPLVRIWVLRADRQTHYLVVSIHLIAADGWSWRILCDELAVAYRAAITGEPAALPGLPVQYADWAGWQAEQLTVARRAALVQWWRGELAGAPVRLELPRPRAQAGAPRGRRLHRRLDRAAMASLAAFATAERQTAFGALAAVCGAVLARCTGQDRLLLGVAVAHRDRPEVEHVLGLFVDSVALRVDLTGDPRFAELVRRVASAMAAAYDHRDLPFDQLVAAIDPPGPPEPSRRRDRSPGIQVHFAHHPAGSIGCIALHGCTVTERVVDASTAKFELMLRVEQVADGAVLWAEFDSAQIEPAWAERLLVDYAELLGAAVCHPDRRLSELPPRAR